ncbi:hypothetical protein [Gracilibacillus dipsosauri]|uniref:hypothetical protein n=1 Tax=Gracilibacillus dipsosauri TaxID=178340 RepID=UPI00240A012B
MSIVINYDEFLPNIRDNRASSGSVTIDVTQRKIIFNRLHLESGLVPYGSEKAELNLTMKDGQEVTIPLSPSITPINSLMLDETVTIQESWEYAKLSSIYFQHTNSNGATERRTLRFPEDTVIIFNVDPSIDLTTTNNRTLYENDTYNISGTAQDSDAGDVVTVRYSINNGQERAIDTRISDGSSFSFNHTLTFRQGRLYRNDTAVTGELAEGSEHVLRVWVEDDNGGQSEVVQRSFYVVPNRMPELTVEPFGSRSDLIDSDKITFRGEASDPDGNDITVSYKINNGSYQQVYSGQGGVFEFQVEVGSLNDGENNVTIRSQDSYGAEVQKVLRVNKSGESVPLKTAVERYKIIPPNGTAKGVVLWLQRETGDLIANARIHMGANGEPENFQDMTLEATSFVEDGIEEDEWTFDNGEEAENIILEVTMERNSTSSDEGIKLINGVLS